VQAILSIFLLLVGGNFRQLFTLAIFAEWLFYMIAASSIFVFRQRQSDIDIPYRMWGYPILPALFVLASALLLCWTFAGNFRNSAAGLLIILAGIPVFYGFARKRSVSSVDRRL
jgi:APA family basic amino acid/polyamine antiporter